MSGCEYASSTVCSPCVFPVSDGDKRLTTLRLRVGRGVTGGGDGDAPSRSAIAVTFHVKQ